MFGATPGTFKSVTAAFLVAKGYTLEERIPWCVVLKEEKYLSNPRIITVCRIDDLEAAHKEGYSKVEFGTLEDIASMVPPNERDDFLIQITDTIKSNKLIEAMRVIRNACSLDLTMSKRIVDSNWDAWRTLLAD
jgi:hypothetical protein